MANLQSSAKKFGLAYISPDKVDAYLEKYHNYLLGVIGFGRKIPIPRAPNAVWLDIPVLGGNDTSIEVWTSDTPTTAIEHNGLKASTDGNIVFGSIQLEQKHSESLESLANQAYMRIFRFIDEMKFHNLIRVWNYFPRINDVENGLERYRGFNIGRHEAFVANGRGIGEENIPAASALGCNSGSLTIYFIAGKHPGKAIENPRQVSAFQYPKLFGPSSPTFVRAMFATVGAQQCFFISGTASIVGYETVHHGDVEKQSSETLLNIRTLLNQVPHFDTTKGRMLLKVYLRRTEFLELIQTALNNEFGSNSTAVYLLSNICRSDLLLEIECAYFVDV